jgi:hypothetical protein
VDEIQNEVVVYNIRKEKPKVVSVFWYDSILW